LDIHTPKNVHSSRIDTLDILRGFALLGILIMNIQSFAMPTQAYLNPFALTSIQHTPFDTQGMDLFDRNGIVYMITHIFADQKFMAIFSILFGVGIALMVESHHKKTPTVSGKPVSSLKFLLRRNFFLLLIGLEHAYFIWEGDILVSYSLCGFFVVWFRNKSVKFLVSLSALLFAFPVIFLLLLGVFVPEEMVTHELEMEWTITSEQFQSVSDNLRSGWLQQMVYRIPAALEIQIELFILYTFWRVSSLMLLGMALHKLELLRNKISSATFGKWALAAIPLGIGITVMGIHQNNVHQWQAFYTHFFGSQFNYIGSLILSMGYIFGLLALYQHLPHWISYALQAIGRTALSNYILQSLICAFIFYGHGLGMYAQLDRFQQLLLLPGIWIFQSLLSILWLKHFPHGPLEWLWRYAVCWPPASRKKC